AQGGDLAAALAAGLDARGRGVIVPASRAVAGAADPRQAALDLRDRINAHRIPSPARGGPWSGAAGGPGRGPSGLILALHDAGCIQFGEFTLASGKQSPIYVDLRRVASYPALLRQVADAYAALIRPLTFDCLAAVPYAALPIGAAVALQMDRPLVYPRKEAKAHGTGRAVEGVFAPGDTALVLEDVATSAGSLLRAIETLEAAGLTVRDAVVLLDREQGGPASLAARGYHLHAVLQMTEVLDVLRDEERISGEEHQTVVAYLGTVDRAR
ncbi:MAG: orotate phosphoribosyltransferase, partial [Chloroflexi bacterium]|nr:orotate phosphoribosyltransferase [Chloroflexota bacterium]